MVRVLDAAPAHLDHGLGVGIFAEAELGRLHHLAVIDGDEAGRTHQVGLAQTPHRHLVIVIGVAEEGPVQLEHLRAQGLDLAHGQRVGLLLDDEVGPDRLHDHRGVAGELGHRLKHLRVVKPEFLVELAHFPRPLGGLLLAAARDLDRVHAGLLVHLDLGGIVGPEKPEGDQEDVQQAGVIGVLEVLEHELPVGPHALARIAQNAELAPVEHPVEVAQHLGSEIILERPHGVIEGGEDDTAPDGALQGLEVMVLELEIVGHAALILDPAAEGYGGKHALEVVGPLVIGAGELLGVAVFAVAESRAAMGATVDQDVDAALHVANDDDRPGADPGALEIPGIGDIRFERHIAVGGAGENPLLLPVIDPGIGIDPVRDPAVSLLGPFIGQGLVHHPILTSKAQTA